MKTCVNDWLLRGAFSGILLLAAAPVPAADALVASLVKGQHFQQTNASTVAPGDNYAELSASVTASSANAVSAASLLLPNFTLQNLAQSDDYSFDFYASYGSLAAMDLAFSNGPYVLRMTGVNDGLHGVSVSLASNTTPLYPPTPAVLNFDAAQAIDATNTFTLSWGPFTNGTANDFIKVTVRDLFSDSVVYQTPEPGMSGALNGLATAHEIPANTLPTDTPLEGELVFARPATVDFTTYPGVLCFSAFYKRTSFPMAAQIIQPPDVFWAGVRKGLQYQQTSASNVIAQTGNRAARFRAYAVLNAENSLASAQVLVPTTYAIQTLVQTDPLIYNYTSNFTSLSALDLTFPNGQYVLMLTGNQDGYRPVPVYLTNNAYPNVPRALNFDAAQTVDITSDFTLSWNSFTNGTTNDFVQVQINSTNNNSILWKSPDPGRPGLLNGLATSVTIPAFSLPPGQGVSVQIVFAKTVYRDDQTYPGVPCVAVYYSSTSLPLTSTNQPDYDGPWMDETYPWQNQENVPRNSGLVLTFSEPMRSGYSIAWDGITNEFTYTWSADRTTLFCTTPGLLPSNTTVSYILNPSSNAVGFSDLAGNPFSMDWYGQFQTGAGVATPDVRQYAVYKMISYMQTNAPAVVYDSSQPPFVFGASVELNVPAGVTNATVRYGAGADQVLPANSDYFELNPAFASSNLLQAAYPDGTYTLTLGTVHDGVRSLALDLSGNTYPGAPRLANWAAAQAINPATNFTLAWDPYTNLAGLGLVNLEIEIIHSEGEETVLRTPNPGEPGALPPTTTNVMIPASILSPGRTYVGRLMFVNLTQSNSVAYPGAQGIAGYAVMTRFTLACTGTPLRPGLQGQASPDGHFQLHLSGVPNVPYNIEVAGSLEPGSWMPFMSGKSTNGLFDWQDWNATSNHNSRFYRAREGW